MEENTIILYLPIIFFFISLVLLLTQGIYNYVFLNSSSKINVIERLLFEQFSYEVYSSINVSLPKQIITKTEKCDDGYEEMRFNLNLESYYDCRGIFTTDLYPNCRDQIIKSTDSCSYYDTLNSDTSIANDQRIRYCIYFSNYTQQIAILEGTRICKSKDNFNYEQLLSYSLPLYDLEGIPNSCDESQYKNCGILDTMNNILCFPKDYDCPFNKFKSVDSGMIEYNNNYNSKVIVSAIVSKNHPLNHEWDSIVGRVNEKSNEKNINEIKISPLDFKLFDEEFDYTYEKQDNVYLSATQLISENNILDKGYISDDNLEIYTRSYIGFKNTKELNKFNKYFKKSNNRDNPLFRLSSPNHHNPIITIVFSGVFLIVSILYGILSFTQIIGKNNRIHFILFFAIVILYLIGNLIIIIYHAIRCPLIYIDMDKRMKKVLDAYNKRTIMFQLFRYIGTLSNFISFVFLLIFYIKNKQKQE